MLAIRSIEIDSPFMLEGVTLSLNGNKDAYMVEASEIGRFSAAQQTWEQVAPVIDLSGRSPTCACNQASGTCA